MEYQNVWQRSNDPLLQMHNVYCQDNLYMGGIEHTPTIKITGLFSLMMGQFCFAI